MSKIFYIHLQLITLKICPFNITMKAIYLCFVERNSLTSDCVVLFNAAFTHAGLTTR